MVTLAILSFIAWVLTILAPCVLPVLPVILAGSVGEKGKWYPYIITFSLALSITLFTIILKVSTLFIDIPFSFWKYLSWGILIFLWLTYILPHVWARISTAFGGSRASVGLDKAQNIESSTLRAIFTGAALGPVFSTCSPTYSLLLATVFPVSFLSGVVYTFIYSIGLALMLLLVVHGGRSIISKFRVFADESGWFRRGLGILFLIIGLAIVTGIDKKIETKAIEYFDLSFVENKLIDAFVPKKGVQSSQSLNMPASSSLWDTKKTDMTSGSMSLSGATKVAPPFPLSVKTPYPAPAIPPELTEWINSNPLTMASLKWKVVIIDFWTYSCINCQRTLPYLTAWDRKYRDQWLVILGVHAPEFAFEKKRANVEKAMKTANVAYPVVLDNDFSLWNAYANQYWPAKYFIDREWNIRHTHFGEWAYEESEKVIQYLLSEWSDTITKTDLVSVSISPGTEKNLIQTPETYLGVSRREFASLSKSINPYSFVDPIADNHWTLGWIWKEGPDSITSQKDAKLRLKYTAKNVYLVLWGTWSVRVMLDGKPVSTLAVAGKDVSAGMIEVTSDKMYHIISDTEVGRSRLLELDFSPWVEVFVFTFGS